MTIEARMTSSRLPGKVLKTACGRPLLDLMIERVKRIEHVDEIIIATTINLTDDPIVELARELDVRYFRGSEEDVLGRVLGAAESVGADVIVELTGDCPLIDPDISSQVIEFYLLHDFDYVSNDHLKVGDGYDYDSYPEGMDTEVFSAEMLATADRETQSPDDREHVSLYMFTQPKFSTALVPAPPSLRRPDLRLTLDIESDYVRIKNVFEALYPTLPNFSLRDMLEAIDKDPASFEQSGESESVFSSGGSLDIVND